jgi:hypothetical protein
MMVGALIDYVGNILRVHAEVTASRVAYFHLHAPFIHGPALLSMTRYLMYIVVS